MRPELTQKLVKRFPVLYQDYRSPMTHTCMCWGFEHSDGWEQIIWQLSLAIEEELGYSWLQEKWFLFKKRLSGKWNRWIYKLSPPLRPGTAAPTSKDGKRIKLGLKRLVWFPYTGFAVLQVKEKYGTLRYYCPSNDRIDAFISLAQTLSALTCEVCGDEGKLRDDGWLRTECDSCRASRFKSREGE